MIALLNGKIIEKNTSDVIVDINGVGYFVKISLNTFGQLGEIGSKVILHTYVNVTENDIEIFGFIEKSEREVFKLLKSVAKIGPKSALNILSSATILQLKSFIASANSTALSKIPGIGPKTAERLILELKDKFSKLVLDTKDNEVYIEPNEEAVSALISLGYNRQRSEQLVKLVKDNNKEIDLKLQDVIKIALKYALS